MTNDKDYAALLREALAPFVREIDRLEAEYGFDRPLYQGQCLMLPLSDLLNLRTALQSHGQAFDAAGVREACAKVADGNVMSGNDQWSAGHDAAARKIAHAIRSLPLS
jgi:hypothetical protein